MGSRNLGMEKWLGQLNATTLTRLANSTTSGSSHRMDETRQACSISWKADVPAAQACPEPGRSRRGRRSSAYWAQPPPAGSRTTCSKLAAGQPARSWQPGSLLEAGSLNLRQYFSKPSICPLGNKFHLREPLLEWYATPTLTSVVDPPIYWLLTGRRVTLSKMNFGDRPIRSEL